MSTFCAVPWTQLSTKPNGNIRACCLMSNSKDPDKGVLRDENNTIFNARNLNFKQAYNSEKIKKLRIDMLNGVRNALCQTCWHKEDLGLNSKRIVTNKLYKKEIEDEHFQGLTLSDGTINDIKFTYLDLRFGNTCNLKCIMCHPASSSKWYTDYKQLFNTDHFNDTGEKVSFKNKTHYNWYENQHFWTAIEKNIKDLKQIYLVGGEPLLIKEHFTFLNKIVDLGYAQNIILEYDTNLTELSQKTIALWSHFKKIKLRVSIDSIGKKNNYIRFPSKWNIIKNNIDRAAQIPNVILDLSMTWQIYNLFSITDIWQLFPDIGTMRILSNPNYLSIDILPINIKEKAIEHLQNFHKPTAKSSKQIQSMISYLQKNINAYNEKRFNNFLNYTKKLDKIRGLNFISEFPEYNEFFQDY